MISFLRRKREILIQPPRFSNLKLWLDSSDSNTITKTYQNLVATGSGTSGTKIITASSDQTGLVQAGMKLRIGGADIYTVSSVSTVTINIVENLSTNYVAAAMALDRVSQWNDKSGLANNATQGTVLAQPVYNPSLLNGSAVLTFDGASYLAANGIASFMTGSDKPITAFCVSASTTTSTNSYQYIWGSSSSANPLLGFRYDSTGVYRLLKRDDATTLLQPTGGTTVANTATISTLVNYGTTADVRINNSLILTGTNLDVGTTTIDNFSIGASFRNAAASLFLVGYISDLLIYNRALNAAERAQVNIYLAQKRAITIS